MSRKRNRGYLSILAVWTWFLGTSGHGSQYFKDLQTDPKLMLQIRTFVRGPKAIVVADTYHSAPPAFAKSFGEAMNRIRNRKPCAIAVEERAICFGDIYQIAEQQTFDPSFFWDEASIPSGQWSTLDENVSVWVEKGFVEKVPCRQSWWDATIDDTSQRLNQAGDTDMDTNILFPQWPTESFVTEGGPGVPGQPATRGFNIALLSPSRQIGFELFSYAGIPPSYLYRKNTIYQKHPDWDLLGNWLKSRPGKSFIEKFSNEIVLEQRSRLAMEQALELLQQKTDVVVLAWGAKHADLFYRLMPKGFIEDQSQRQDLEFVRCTERVEKDANGKPRYVYSEAGFRYCKPQLE